MAEWNNKKFIEKAKEVHNDYYNYSKVDYINSGTKVEIICPTHGLFTQNAGSHLSGHGCNKCSTKIQLREQNFFNKAFEIHGNKYDYSKVNYVHSNTVIEIICPIHGAFWKTPKNHLSGFGCKECGQINKHKLTAMSIDEFTKRSTAIHGDKYSYEKTQYGSFDVKLEIICDIHGSFWQTPRCHLDGQGCRVCGIAKMVATNSKTTTQFVQEALEIHGDKYGYENSIYINSATKLEIMCYKHGAFWQTPNHHIDYKSGCIECAREKRAAESWGENNPNYNPNLTIEERSRIRPGMSGWRDKVVKFYNYTCQKCSYIGGQKLGDIVAHHIEAYATNRDLRLEISNGICLCLECHKEFHRIYGRTGTNRTQLEEFLSPSKLFNI